MGFIEKEDLKHVFGATDLVVSAHRMASESGALLTAIGYGKAELAPHFGTFAEKKTMDVLETYANPQDFSKKTSRLLDEDAERKRLEGNARRYPEENDWMSVAERHIQLYKLLKA